MRLNRSDLVLRYRQPYLHWAAGVFGDDPEDAAELREAVSTYPVPLKSKRGAGVGPACVLLREVFE